MRHQVGQPHAVVGVALSAGEVADVRSVAQHQLQALGTEHMPDGAPEDSGGFSWGPSTGSTRLSR